MPFLDFSRGLELRFDPLAFMLCATGGSRQIKLAKRFAALIGIMRFCVGLIETQPGLPEREASERLRVSGEHARWKPRRESHHLLILPAATLMMTVSLGVEGYAERMVHSRLGGTIGKRQDVGARKAWCARGQDAGA